MKKLNIIFLLFCLFLPISLVGCENFNKNTLSTPSNLSVENGVIIFDIINDAQYYIININDTEFTLDAKYSNNVNLIDNQVNYNANKIFTIGESYSVKVKAIAEEMNDSNYSETVSYTHTASISKPENIKINNTTLTWDLVKNASFYLVKIVTPYNTVIYDHAGNILTGDDSTTIAKAELTEYSFTSNTFNFSSLLTKAGNYNFYVNAVNANGSDYTESGYTSKLTYKHTIQLSTPTNGMVVEENNELFMNTIIDEKTNQLVVSCNGYEQIVDLNGSYTNIVTLINNMAKINLTKLFADVDFSIVKPYEFVVKANHTTSSLDTKFYIESDSSLPTVFEKTYKLSTPVLNLTTSTEHNCYMATWSSSDTSNISKYNLYVVTSNGIKTYELENTTTNMLLTEEFIAVSVQAVGSGNYISSNLSNFKTTITSSNLNNINITYSKPDVLTWNNIEGSYYFIEHNNNLIITNENSVNINLSKLNTKSSVVRLTVIKQGYLPYTTTYNLNYEPQLETPMVYGFVSSNPYLLTFSNVDKAIGYYVYIKSSTATSWEKITNIYTSNAVDLSQYVLTENNNLKYFVKVQALADPNSVYKDSNLTSETSVSHLRVLANPTFSHQPVTKKVSSNETTYTLNFNGVENAESYEILINYNKLTIQDESKTTYSVDISKYLTSANNYEIKIRAIPSALETNVYPSEYSITNYILYKQLAEVEDIKISNNDGLYTLSFKPVNNAQSYRVRIVKLADGRYDDYLNSRQLSNNFTIYQATDISNYLVQQGEYHIYVTAIAASNGYYGDSDESSNYGVITKLNSLATPENLVFKNENATTYTLTWTGDSYADYYLVRVIDPNGFKYEFNVYGSTSANISNYLSIQGTYTVLVYSMITPNSANSKDYVSSSAAEISETYIINQPHDFKRSTVTMYGNEYDYSIENVQDLKNILWYHLIYEIDNNYKQPIYITTESDETVREKLIEFANAASSSSLNIYNFKADSVWTDNYAPESQGKTNIQLLHYICEKLLSVYPELHQTSNLTVTSETNTSNIFKIYFKNALKPVNKNAISTTATDYNLTFNYLDEYLRRNSTTSFAIDSKEGVPVTTSEQLLYAVENNYKPLFCGDSENSEIIYDNAKAVLRTIITSNMSDVDKATRIYDWLSYAYNVDFNADKTYNQEDLITANLSIYGARQEYYLEGIFLNIMNQSNTNFDGEFYLGNQVATSVSFAKAYTLLCSIEGIKALSVNGEYTNYKTSYDASSAPISTTTTSHKHNWNLVYLSTTSNSAEKAWYVVDIALSETNYDKDEPTKSYSTINHSYFLVSNETHENMFIAEDNLNKANYYKLTTTDEKAKDIKTAQFNYYSNSTFALTKRQIKTFASTTKQENGFSTEYGKDFEYTKSFNISTNYEKYKNQNYDKVQSYLLNAIFYSKFNMLSNSKNVTSFEFSFNWKDNNGKDSLSDNLVTDINTLIEGNMNYVSLKNNYGFEIQLVSAEEIKDSVNERTIVVLTFRDVV